MQWHQLFRIRDYFVCSTSASSEVLEPNVVWGSAGVVAAVSATCDGAQIYGVAAEVGCEQNFNVTHICTSPCFSYFMWISTALFLTVPIFKNFFHRPQQTSISWAQSCLGLMSSTLLDKNQSHHFSMSYPASWWTQWLQIYFAE